MSYNFKVGDKVRIIGDDDDYTGHLDGSVGVVVELGELRESFVEVTSDPTLISKVWCCFNENLVCITDEFYESELKKQLKKTPTKTISVDIDKLKLFFFAGVENDKCDEYSAGVRSVIEYLEDLYSEEQKHLT